VLHAMPGLVLAQVLRIAIHALRPLGTVAMASK
jgi:hypothetical protein